MSQKTKWLTVLILSGGSFKDKQLGPTTAVIDNPANLADGSKLARDSIATHYLKYDPGINIKLICDHFNSKHRTNIVDQKITKEFIDNQPCVLKSVSLALMKTTTEWVLINPITTIPSSEPSPICMIELGDREIFQEDWSAVRNPYSENPIFQGKADSLRNSVFSMGHPFTGIICSKTSVLRNIINNHPELLDSNDLIELAKILYVNGEARFNYAAWQDLGHQATYINTRLNRLSSRSFNTIEYNETKQTICKYSKDKKRLLEEYEYLTNIPLQAKHYFPIVLSEDRKEYDGNIGSITMEFIPFPNLAELYLHYNLGKNDWSRIISRISHIKGCLNSNYAQKHPKKTIVAKPSWLYSSKLEARIEILEKNPPTINESKEIYWNKFWDNPIRLTLKGDFSSETVNLSAPKKAAIELHKELKNHESPRKLVKIHGDLCFNNILVEPKSSTVKLIDPRGERPEANASWPVGLGDERYDAIKLLHSSRYLYDVIVNNMFDLKITKENITLKLEMPPQYTFVNNMISELIIKNGLSKDEERVLTSSLFFSMIPLHRKEALHCIAFICIGLLIYEDKFDKILSINGL